LGGFALGGGFGWWSKQLADNTAFVTVISHATVLQQLSSFYKKDPTDLTNHEIEYFFDTITQLNDKLKTLHRSVQRFLYFLGGISHKG